MPWQKRITQILFSTEIVFHILLIIQLAVFLILLFRPFSFTPTGHVYTTIDKNFFYPNLILQGKNGSWKILDTHTTLFSPYIFAYTFFIILGKIAALFSIDQVWLYLWARVICGVFAFYTTLWFITHLLPKKYHLLSLLFVLGIEAGPLLSAWPELKTLFDGRILIYRHFGLPHHLFAHATGMVFIGLLILLVQKVTKIRLIGMVVAGLISTISMPAYAFTFALTAFPTWFIWSLYAKNTRRLVPILALASIVILGPNILFSFEFKKGPPWTNSAANEKTWFTTEYIRTEYISTLLLFVPFLILLVIILPFIWKKLDMFMRQLIILLMSWIVGPFFWVVAAKTTWFPMPNHRLTDSYGFLAAGILAAIASRSLISLMPTKQLKGIIAVVLLGVGFIPSIFLSSVYIKQLFAAQQTTDIHIYPSQDLWKGIQFIQTVPRKSGILVREQFGEVIPAFADVRVYVGGIHNFPNWLEWQGMAGWFFSGQMPAERIAEFLKQSDISYVFYGPDEKAVNTTGQLYPQYLKSVFSNNEVTIYKVEL